MVEWIALVTQLNIVHTRLWSMIQRPYYTFSPWTSVLQRRKAQILRRLALFKVCAFFSKRDYGLLRLWLMHMSKWPPWWVHVIFIVRLKLHEPKVLYYALKKNIYLIFFRKRLPKHKTFFRYLAWDKKLWLKKTSRKLYYSMYYTFYCLLNNTFHQNFLKFLFAVFEYFWYLLGWPRKKQERSTVMDKGCCQPLLVHS